MTLWWQKEGAEYYALGAALTESLMTNSELHLWIGRRGFGRDSITLEAYSNWNNDEPYICEQAWAVRRGFAEKP